MRLTKKINGAFHGKEGKSIESLTRKWCRGQFEATAIVDKLAEYEDAEENRMLVKLPYPIDTPLYFPFMDGVSKFEIRSYRIDKIGNDVYAWMMKLKNCSNGQLEYSVDIFSEDIGRRFFLTRKEAEAKLKEIKDKEES